MLTATQLKNGTRFSASGQIGVFKKIGQNEDGTVTATMLFGSDPQEVGKEVSLPGNLPCYYHTDAATLKAQSAQSSEHKHQNERNGNRRSRNSCGNKGAIHIVAHDETIIKTIDAPSAPLAQSILSADSYKIDGKKYAVEEIAHDFDSGETFVIVAE